MARKKKRARKKPIAPTSTTVQRKRKQWSDESMIKALEEAAKGKVPIYRIAKKYKVPCTTLKDRVKGRVQHGTNPGPRPYLNKDEEEHLADHLTNAAKLGYGKTRKQVKAFAEKVAREKGILRKERITDGWWNKFMKRQDQISLRRADSTAHVRMDSVNNESIKYYYDLLEATLDKDHLNSSPGQIYNMDETGIPLDPRPPNIVAKRGQKKVRYRQSGKKEQISVIGCGNAAGQAIPPMVIFEGKYLNYLWTVGEVPGTIYGMSEKGWTDQELFLHWLKHFLKYANPGRPLLLLLDGHSSHFELSSIELAREKGVTILCLPPHTTHESQPLDSAVFGPLKKHWTQECHDFQQKNPGAVITKYNFSKLFSKAWLKSLSPHNLISGFKNCGVHPFDRTAIKIVDDEPQPDIYQSDAPEPGNSTNQTDLEQSNAIPSLPEITDELRKKFERRRSEGYDLPDPLYQKWLDTNYPESICEHFPDVHVLNPVPISETVEPTTSPSEQRIPMGPAKDTQISNEYSSTLETFMETLKTKQTTSTRAITTARVLTSNECYNVIKEKEMKKKAEEEEKQKRKREREEKRKIVLETKQKKAEEKARKLAEKARATETRRKEKNVQKQTTTTSTESHKAVPKPTSHLGKRSLASNNRKIKKVHFAETEVDYDNETQCCVCFDDYVEGDEWVQCTCGRWLHEDCIIEVIEDSNGLPRLCPYCIA